MIQNARKGMPSAFVHVLFAAALFASHAHAQGTRPADANAVPATSGPASGEQYVLQEGMNEWGVRVGGSFNSPTLIGTAEDRKYFTVGLRYGRVFAASKRVAYEYTVDAVPVAVVFQPNFARAFNRVDDGSVYGAGLSPIGFKANFNRRGRVKPFVGGSGGAFYFQRPVPVDVPGATRFNFTFEFTGGVQFFTPERRAVTLGYKFHHISNANRSDVNPGLDANVIYVGYSFFK
jgi:hypothetical protein